MAVIVLAAVVAAGVYLARRAMHPAGQAPAPAMPAAPSSAPAAAAPIRHPIDRAAAPAAASTSPLPALADSDASVLSALGAMAGGHDLAALLTPNQIIPRIVATVDALPRHTLGRSVLPVRSPAGAFAVARADGGATVMDARNAARYAAYVQAVQDVDSKALAAWYVREYPLFQQAYRELGYPKGYFNDRLIAVIDLLLATPEPSQPPELTPVKGYYAYADPSLESLSIGQKMLLRAGPAGEAAVKAKLRELRAQLTGRTLPGAH